MSEDSPVYDTGASRSADDAQAAPRSMAEAMATMSPARLRQLRLAKLGAVHFSIWLLAMGLFAAADSWRMLSDLALASFLAVLTGALAGLVTANFMHEWAHYVGARRSGGAYDIPDKLGLFVYDWKFESNSVTQFLTMSRAGTLGGVIALLLVWWCLPMDTLARAAVLSGAVAAFVLAARIEWPVLRRVAAGGDPFTELSKTNEQVLKSAFIWATLAGLLTLWLVAP